MTRNLPVPAFTPAPPGHRWLWWVGPPAVATWLYRTIFPAPVRRLWGLRGGISTSHTALALILSGGGWAAFARALRVDEGNWFDLKPPGG